VGGSRRRPRSPPPAPAAGAAGEAALAASFEADGRANARELQLVEYAHITRRPLYREAATKVALFEARIADGLHIGYIEGAGDDGALALEQLGARVTRITPDELAAGDLSRYHAIVSGIRAYEVRPDILANNARLIEYARAGGTYVAQYNKYEFPEGGFPPYPIAYRSITPKESECENLLVPVCLSASHIAYGSIRMEPVFMVLGQSAATAACQAIEAGVAVQDVNFRRLRERLLEDGQVLEWTGPRREPVPRPGARPPAENRRRRQRERLGQRRRAAGRPCRSAGA
jgi:hypothetical protein